MSPLITGWSTSEVTWIRDSSGMPLFAIIYADDILLLATSSGQLVRMLNSLQDRLEAIGLHLARVSASTSGPRTSPKSLCSLHLSLSPCKGWSPLCFWEYWWCLPPRVK